MSSLLCFVSCRVAMLRRVDINKRSLHPLANSDDDDDEILVMHGLILPPPPGGQCNWQANKSQFLSVSTGYNELGAHLGVYCRVVAVGWLNRDGGPIRVCTAHGGPSGQDTAKHGVGGTTGWLTMVPASQYEFYLYTQSVLHGWWSAIPILDKQHPAESWAWSTRASNFGAEFVPGKQCSGIAHNTSHATKKVKIIWTRKQGPIYCVSRLLPVRPCCGLHIHITKDSTACVPQYGSGREPRRRHKAHTA